MVLQRCWMEHLLLWPSVDIWLWCPSKGVTSSFSGAMIGRLCWHTRSRRLQRKLPLAHARFSDLPACRDVKNESRPGPRSVWTSGNTIQYAVYTRKITDNYQLITSMRSQVLFCVNKQPTVTQVHRWCNTQSQSESWVFLALIFAARHLSVISFFNLNWSQGLLFKSSRGSNVPWQDSGLHLPL